MKTITPEIAWHNRDPVYSVDLQPRIQESSSDDIISSPAKWYRLATSGTDSQVVIWKIWHRRNSPSSVDIEPISQLTRHEKAVNVVRFTPTGEDVLASADVDGIIILWKLDSSNFGPSNGISNGTQSKKSDDDHEIIVLSSQSDEEAKKSKKPSSKEEELEDALPNLFEEETIKIEVWNQWKTLRGHLEDVVDISWSSDGNTLVSASVDNEAIVWDAVKGVKLHMLTGHKSWVQGVSFDPMNENLVTLGADRNLRIYSCSSRKFLYKVDKGSVLHGEDSFVRTRLFYDYTLPSFTRRLAYSPGGEFLLAPSGVIEFPKKVAITNGDETITNCGQTVSNQGHSQNGDENSDGKESDVVVLDDDEENNEGVQDVEMAEEEEEEEEMDADDESDEKENSNEGSVKSGESSKSGEDNEQGSGQPKTENGQGGAMSDTPKKRVLTKRAPKGDSAKKVEKKVEIEEDDSDLGYVNVCHLFLRQDLKRPFCYFPTDKFCHAVRFCPIRYKLDSPEDIETDFPYPYRIIFAIATQSSVILYDSSQLDPFGYISDIHYTRISDLSWSPDGRLLMVSSTDGFCTFVTFEEGELGEPYEGPTFNWEPELKEPAKISDEAMEEIFSTVIANALATEDSNSCHGKESEEKMEEEKVEADANSNNPAKPITPKTPSIASIFTKVPKSEGLKKTFNSTLFTSPIIPGSSKRKENGSISGEEVIIIDEDSLGKGNGKNISNQQQCQSPQVKKLKDSNGNATPGSGSSKKPIEVKKSTPPLFATYSRKVTDNGSRVLENETKNLEYSGGKSNGNNSNCGLIIIDDNLPSPSVPSTPSSESLPSSTQSNELKSPLKSDQKKPIVPRRVSFITLTKPKEN